MKQGEILIWKTWLQSQSYPAQLWDTGQVTEPPRELFPACKLGKIESAVLALKKLMRTSWPELGQIAV